LFQTYIVRVYKKTIMFSDILNIQEYIMENINTTKETTVEITTEAAQVKLGGDAITMVEKEKPWINAASVAALAAAGTAAVTMLGKREVSIGSVAGAVAGVGTAYLGTKWLSEAIGVEDHALGKAMGLFIGIDMGYALTNLGSKVHAQYVIEESTQNYL